MCVNVMTSTNHLRLKDETMDYEIADLVHIDSEKQIAVIITEDGKRIGVNLWEVVGYERESDGFTSWQYALTGE